MLRLRILKDGAEVHNVELAKAGKPQLVVGRAPESDIRLDDRAVGREHAVIQLSSAKGFSIQKKSKFGKLSVNGAETSEAAVKAGDIINIADYLVKVEDDGAAPAAAPAAASAASVSSGENTPPQGIIAPGAEPPMDQPPELAAVPEGNTNDIKVAPPEGGEAAAAPVDGAAPAAEGATGEAAPAGDAPAVEGGDAGLALETGEPSQATGAEGGEFNADAGDRTAMISTAKVVTKLVFKPGEANVEEFVLKKPEIAIGRGSTCDVVIEDKKSSRKHLVIKRVGMNFVAKDLGSANGTYVNGVKITEQELAGDDVLRIGTTEFTFKAISQEYFDQEQAQEFIAPPAEEEPQPEADPNAVVAAGGAVPMELAAGAAMDPNAAAAMGMDPNAMGGVPGMTGSIPGLNSGGPQKKKSLVDKFKALPKSKQIMIAAGVGLLVILALQDDEPPKDKKPKPTATAVASTDAAFNALPEERKQFVNNAYDLAFESYKKQDFEKAVYEVDKILQILPNGYKDAKEIKQFAQKSIDIQKANEEERKRKEAEEKLRKEVAEFVQQAEKAVADGKEAEAKELFAKVLERDPDNPTILRLRQQIEEREAQKKAEEEARKEKEFKQKQMENTLKEGRDLLAAGKYFEAIDKMQEAVILFAGDQAAIDQAKAISAKAAAAIKAKLKPHLEAGRAALAQQDYPNARDHFYRALKVDSTNAEANKALRQIREVLHDRSKKIYVEGIVAESVSDFKTAKVRYKECLDSAVREDKYFGMCLRKYKRFEGLDRASASSAGPIDGGLGTDPKPPALPSAPALDPDKPADPAPPADAGGASLDTSNSGGGSSGAAVSPGGGGGW